MVLTFCLVKIFNFLLYNIKNKMYFHKKLYLIFRFITLYLFNLFCVLHIAPSNSKLSNVTSILYNCIQCSFFGSQRYIFGRNDMCFLHDVGQNGLFFLISEGKRVIPFLKLQSVALLYPVDCFFLCCCW